MLEFLALAQQCAPTVSPQTMAAIVNVESGYNPYAIGVVGGRLVRQPASLEEAIATTKALEAEGWNFSMGIAQVNRYNLPRYQINYGQAFDACTNLRVGSKILEECFMRASKRTTDPQKALQAAISCYYSGNFTRGFQPDAAGKQSYVQKVLASTVMPSKAIPVVPSIQTGNGTKPLAMRTAEAAAPAALRQTQSVRTSTPSDNAPVLLRPSNPTTSVTNRESPATAGPTAAVVDPRTRNNETKGEGTSPGTADTPRSTIVF